MSGRNFIGSPAPATVGKGVAIRLDADTLLAREGLRLTQRNDFIESNRMRTVYGVTNGLGILLAESLNFYGMREWQFQLNKT